MPQPPPHEEPPPHQASPPYQVVKRQMMLMMTMTMMMTRRQRLGDVLSMQRAAWQVETHHEAVSLAGGKMPRTEAWLIPTLSKLGLRMLARMRQLIQPPLNVAKKA